MYGAIQNSSVRSVYLKTQFRGGVICAVYKDLIGCPPDGYQFVVERLEPVQQDMSKLNKNRLLIYKFDKKIKDSPYVREIWREAKTLPYVALKRIQSYWNSHEVQADLARHLIEEGEFSTKNRNKKLKRIFDETLKTISNFRRSR
jgi:hypothetical protein